MKFSASPLKIRSLLLAFALPLCFFLAGACNYNYYLGKEKEAEGRYEQANIEYRKALIDDPEDEDFLASYRRTSLLTAENMRERYLGLIGENRFLSANDLLERALALDPENSYFLEEREKWKRVLLTGKVDLNFERLGERLSLADRMEFAVRLNTPNQDRVVFTEIDLRNGLFRTEDFLYLAGDSFLLLYSINAIGVSLESNFEDGLGGTLRNSKSFENFIAFGTPVLSRTSGVLQRKRVAKSSVFRDAGGSALRLDEASEFEFPSSKIFYSAFFKDDRVEIDSDSRSIDFLPVSIHLNEIDDRVLLDFGHLELKFFEEKDRWGMRRIENGKEHLLDLRETLTLTPYFSQTEPPYFLERI